MNTISRRIVLQAGSMLALAMSPIATPVFSIEIPDADLAIVGGDLPTHAIFDRAFTTKAGRDYRVFLAIPRGAPPEAGFRILYMLDGNAAFAALTPEMLASVPDLVIAGIGYPGDKAFDVVARSLDYTPLRAGQSGPIADPQRPDRMIGGAPDFAEVLVSEVRDFAEQDLSVDPAGRTLWGHSYGGLMALFMLHTNPDSFAGFVAVSPSLWWGGGAIGLLEDRAVIDTAPRAKVLLMLGDMESRSNTPTLPEPLPAPETMALIARLQARADLDARGHVLKGAQHGMTLKQSLPFALDLAAKG